MKNKIRIYFVAGEAIYIDLEKNLTAFYRGHLMEITVWTMLLGKNVTSLCKKKPETF